MKTSNEVKGGGVKTPSRQGLYAYSSRYAREAIDVLVEIMRTSRNENLKLGAAKAQEVMAGKDMHKRRFYCTQSVRT